MKRNAVLLCLSVLAATPLWAQSSYPGQHAGKIKMERQAEMKAYSFDMQDVRLLDSPFRQNRERASKWILSIGVNQLLQSFRNTSGTYAANEGGYDGIKKLGGWESLDCDLRGHTTGHILSALAYLYASTGDEQYKVKSDSLVKGLAEVQQVYSATGHKGYISAYGEGLIDRNIAGKSVWAPWYTLHKIYAGLIDQYLYCNSQLALEIMENAAQWAYNKLMPLTEEQRKVMLRNEFGGVNEAFYHLYSITGKPEHKKLAEFFYHAAVIDPLAEHKDELKGKHANTFIPKLNGEAFRYEFFGETRSKDIASFFWNTVLEHQTFCTGGNSHKEKFIPSDEISKYLTGYTQETCNTNNMLKLTRHLFCWDAEAAKADFYERALYNHILGQQDPESGMVAYFLPLLPGAHKVYSTPDRSFWCCVGTGFENHVKYGEAIYYHNNKGIYVNLFIPSELTWKEKGIKLVQETNFPNDGHVTLTVKADKAQQMAVYLRYPYWSSNVEVRVNGKKIKVNQKPSSYITIERTWKSGDWIEVNYPMSLHLAAANDNPNKVAVMYGPLVMAGAMGTEGMKAPAPFSDPNKHNDYYTYNYNVPANLRTSLSIDKNNPSKSFKKLETEKPVFISEKEGVRLEPLYSIHRQRYVVYWDVEK